MLINEVLKQERTKLGLTQKEFIGAICTPANYSKIERGQQQITARDLLLILSKNKINYYDFLNKIIDDYKIINDRNTMPQDQIAVKMVNAFYSADKQKVRKINAIIQTGNYNYELKLVSDLIYHVIQGTLNQISPKLKQKYKKALFDSISWTQDVDKIRLFSNVMLIFENDELEFYMSELLRQDVFLKTKDIYTLEVVASAFVNYLYNCYKRGITINVIKTLDAIYALPEIPELFTYKCLGNYYRYLISGNRDAANEIRQFMLKNGLADFVQNTLN